MAASAWQLYNEAKKYIGNGTIKLGAGVTTKFYMQLHTSASNASTFTLSVSNSVDNQVAATGGYVAGGRALVPDTGLWIVNPANAKQMKFTMSAIGIAFTASGANIADIKFAVLRNSVSSGVGKVLCWCKLSSSEFDLASPNTLTVLPAATGIFTLT